MEIFDNLGSSVGNTPLIRLNRISKDCKAEIIAKLESANPLGCVKDRIGVAMLDAAEEMVSDTAVAPPVTASATCATSRTTVKATGVRAMPSPLATGRWRRRRTLTPPPRA